MSKVAAVGYLHTAILDRFPPGPYRQRRLARLRILPRRGNPPNSLSGLLISEVDDEPPHTHQSNGRLTRRPSVKEVHASRPRIYGAPRRCQRALRHPDLSLRERLGLGRAFFSDADHAAF